MRQRILFVAQNMDIGGIQTSLVNLLKFIEKQRPDELEISLFTFGKGDLLSEVPKSVSVTVGNRFLQLSAEPFFSVLKRRQPVDIFLRILLMLYVRLFGSERFYRKQFQKCMPIAPVDVAISYFNDAPNTYFNQGTNLFVSEFVQAGERLAWIHSDPIKGNFDANHCRKIYENFDRIVCVSRAVEDNFHKLVPELSKKTEVICNVIPVEEVQRLAQVESPYSAEQFHIVTVGRVDNASKRMDGMVRLCARLKQDGITGFCWHIVGNGPDLPGNQQLARELGVDELVCFEGEKINPFPYIKHADLFALYSAYEGFPMVIGEAQALDTFILTTNYAAAKEQILPEQGIIAEDDEEFYQELKRLILCRS